MIQVQEIGQLIKKLRKKNNMTQVEFSIKSGLGLRFIRELENGKQTARIDKVIEALNFFGYTIRAVKLGGDE